MPAESAPIFVIGTGRSGTTLLRCMLSAHPRIYIAHEPSFYLFEKIFEKRREPRGDFADYFFQSENFRWLGLDPARVSEGLPRPLPPERYRDLYAAVMREMAARYGRPRFGEKTPIHSFHVARIFRDFPDARVVHIQRDPRDTTMSLVRMPWASSSLWLNAAYCETEWKAVTPYLDRVLSIRLEDLLADPRATMARVLDHVGEPWDDAVLDHPQHCPRGDMPPYAWLESSMTKVETARKPQWTRLRPVEIRLIERTARRVMADGKYEPAKVDVEPNWAAVMWEKIRTLPENAKALGTLARISKLSRDPKHFGSPASRELWRRLNPKAWPPDFVIPTAPPLLGSAGAPRALLG